MLIKIQPDATVCRYLFTAKSLYIFRVSQHPSSGVLKTVTAASGAGHNTGTATSQQRGRSRWPPGLRHGSGAAQFLALSVLIPLGARLFVSCDFCVFSCPGLRDGLITRKEESCRVWCAE